MMVTLWAWHLQSAGVPTATEAAPLMVVWLLFGDSSYETQCHASAFHHDLFNSSVSAAVEAAPSPTVSPGADSQPL